MSIAYTKGTANVTQWRDKSGTGYIGSTTSGTNTDTLNSKKVIYLNNLLSIPSFAWRSRFTVFFVGKISMLYSQFNGGYLNYLFTENGNLYNVAGTFSVTDSATSSPIAGNSAWYLLCLGYSGGTTATPYSLNGTTRTTGTGTAAGESTTTFELNFSGRSGGSPNSGNVAEILHYNEPLTTPQVQKVEGYLAWKWGLQANLPAGHPYKLAPP